MVADYFYSRSGAWSVQHRNASNPSRREFLRVSALGAAAMCVGPGCAQLIGASGHRKIPLGVQLYSVREQCADDLPGTLEALAKIGYVGVEFAGYHGRSAVELRQMLDDLGLIACGTHTPYESVLGDRLQATTEFNRILGNEFLIVPSMEAKSKQGWLEKAARFNELADMLKPEGMWIGYHAHAHDFQKFDGETAWDLFFGNTKEEVIMQLDTSNCLQGGADPVTVLKRYPGRARTIHLKPNGSGPEAVIGEDRVDWAGVLDYCETQGGTEWYVVEHETSKDPISAVARGYEALQRM